MKMTSVDVGTDHRLELPAQQPLRQLHPNLMRQLTCHLARREALNQVIALHAAFFVPDFLQLQHILERRFTGAAERRLKQTLLSFAGIEDVANAIVQPMHPNDTGICHFLPIVPHLLPGRSHQPQHQLNFFVVGLLVGIRQSRQLVDVVAQPRNFSQ